MSSDTINQIREKVGLIWQRINRYLDRLQLVLEFNYESLPQFHGNGSF